MRWSGRVVKTVYPQTPDTHDRRYRFVSRVYRIVTTSLACYLIQLTDSIFWPRVLFLFPFHRCNCALTVLTNLLRCVKVKAVWDGAFDPPAKPPAARKPRRPHRNTGNNKRRLRKHSKQLKTSAAAAVAVRNEESLPANGQLTSSICPSKRVSNLYLLLEVDGLSSRSA